MLRVTHQVHSAPRPAPSKVYSKGQSAGSVDIGRAGRRSTGQRTVGGRGFKSPAMMRGNMACMRLMSENLVSSGDRNCGRRPCTSSHLQVWACGLAM